MSADHCVGSNKEGVGLGLYICNQLVQMLGPDTKLQFETVVNKGSYFYFNIFGEEKRQLQTIGSPIFECGNIHSAQIVEDTYTANENKNPVESIIPTIQTKPANPGNREKPAFRQLRLMIVDDNIFNIMTLEKILNN